MAARRPKRTAKKKTASRKRAGPRNGPAGNKATGAGGPDTWDRVAQLQRLIAVMVEAGAVEVEVEEAGAKLRVRLKEEIPPPAYPPPAMVPHTPLGGSTAAAPGAGYGQAAVSPEPQPGTEVFKSPMLGTFYRAASPDAEPFVEVGDRVGADATLCIIEAMKVMNEIKAEREMEIVDILVQNGDPVEYGQPLFVVKV